MSDDENVERGTSESDPALAGLSSKQANALALALRVLETSHDLCVFNQDRFWAAHGKRWELDELNPDQLIKILSFLFDNVEFYHVRMVGKLAAEMTLTYLRGDPDADPDPNTQEAASAILDSEPVEWLNSTVLVSRLTKLLDSLEFT